ncbi:hypothetical protein ACO0LM_15915 [Undibacterium sp. Di26W]|uniref:hypothetical protein n=1 Tax=Undibacterium sp. Di26W TaxID=3413035 RepID=UPI003BF21A6F
MLDVHYATLKKSVDQNLKRVLTEEEEGSVSSLWLLSEQNHEDLEKLKNSSIVAWAYLSYILTPDISSYARGYVYDVLSGKMRLDEFINNLGDN